MTYTLNYKVLKINLQGLCLVTNQYSDLNINLKDLILSYKHLELNQKCDRPPQTSSKVGIFHFEIQGKIHGKVVF